MLTQDQTSDRLWQISPGLTLDNLKGANLEGANLNGMLLGGANLQGANLRGAQLNGSYLVQANLRGADCQGASFAAANLSCVQLACTNLIDAYLHGANLTYATHIIYACIDIRGYTLVGWQRDEWWFNAGCRSFPLEQALAHWGGASYPDQERGQLYVKQIKLMSEVKLYGK